MQLVWSLKSMYGRLLVQRTNMVSLSVFAANLLECQQREEEPNVLREPPFKARGRQKDQCWATRDSCRRHKALPAMREVEIAIETSISHDLTQSCAVFAYGSLNSSNRVSCMRKSQAISSKGAQGTSQASSIRKERTLCHRQPADVGCSQHKSC